MQWFEEFTPFELVQKLQLRPHLGVPKYKRFLDTPTSNGDDYEMGLLIGHPLKDVNVWVEGPPTKIRTFIRMIRIVKLKKELEEERQKQAEKARLHALREQRRLEMERRQQEREQEAQEQERLAFEEEKKRFELDAWTQRAVKALGTGADVNDVEAFMKVESAHPDKPASEVAAQVHRANYQDPYRSCDQGDSLAALNGRPVYSTDEQMRNGLGRAENLYKVKVPSRFKIAEAVRAKTQDKASPSKNVKKETKKAPMKRFSKLEFD